MDHRQLVTHKLSKIIIATVELVVPQDECIEAELVDSFPNPLATVILEVHGSLRAARQNVTQDGADQNWEKRTWNSSPMLRNKLFFFCGRK